ncbi:UNVERIFIED_CONTAM: hypothetical protein PYX00_000038 [Menopon gallinae]|uniref:Uncharacterized protein n=1 Tax=Menopon gallinae TaxID=328185 RepID=A0AAW2I7G4_9NEOP
MLLGLTAAVRQPKCSLTLDELNCVNATLDDLPKTLQLAKDLKFLESDIPVLKKGDFDNFPHLTDFVCLDCNISAVRADALWGLKNLIRVELYGNNLTVLDMNVVTNCGKIKDFVVSWNRGLVVPENRPFLISSTLTNLDLTGNDITQVFPVTFSRLPALKGLTLAGNLLQRVSPEVLSGLKNLNFVDLSRNRFRVISLSAFPKRVRKVRLGWNPWFCDCSLFPVIQWSKSRDVEEDVRCFQPQRVKWKEFVISNCSSELVDAIRQRKINSDG